MSRNLDNKHIFIYILQFQGSQLNLMRF